jgi:DNA-binding beta-propeller fold protein YncE
MSASTIRPPQAATRAAVVAVFLLVGGCGRHATRTPNPNGASSAGSPEPRSAGQGGERFAIQPLPLPGASGTVTLDYFTYDRARARLWVPAGNTASVDVIDGKTDEITRIQGFHTAEVSLRGKRPVLGPTSVTIGDGVVYVGNRADAHICIIDATTLKPGDCTAVAPDSAGLAASPDGLVYVAPTKELWMTTGAPPLGVAAGDRSISIFDASTPTRLTPKAKLALGGSAEGYAVDEARGLFYTNLEEAGETIAIDVRRDSIVSRWHSGCDQPRGLALDPGRGLLFVACSDRVVSLDAAHGGRIAGSISTGGGLDNIDYYEAKGVLYAAASEVGTLTVAQVDADGGIRRVATVQTAVGARGVVADGAGRAYIADPVGGRILKLTPN